MKLSDKILLGFFGFIFLYLNAAFIEIRVSGIPNFINNTNSIAETKEIAGVTYVVLDNLDEHINITASDTPRIEVRSFTGDMMKKLAIQTMGDTLTLRDLQSDDNKRVKITVFVPTNFKGITVNKSGASIDGLHQDRLHIVQNNGRLWMSSGEIGSLQLIASAQSQFDISQTKIDTVTAQLHASQLLLYSPVNILKGEVIENSLLRLKDAGEIQVRKDKSSKLEAY